MIQVDWFQGFDWWNTLSLWNQIFRSLKFYWSFLY